MDLRQLAYVVAIAETGSFTKAADRCFVVQSALSHQVARLERELNARLFDRSSRHVRLTPAGEAFLPAARQCLLAADRARAEVSAATGEIRGNLRIGVIPTVAAVDLPAELLTYQGRHPQVRVTLRMRASADLVREVSDGTLDVAFLGLPGHVEIHELPSHLLGRDRLVAVVAAGHPLAALRRTRLERIASEHFIDFPLGSGGRAQTDEAFDAAGLTRDVTFEVLDVHLMARLIRARLGVGLLASSFVPQLPGLVAIPIVHAPARAEHMIWGRGDIAPAAAAFIEQIKTSISGQSP